MYHSKVWSYTEFARFLHKIRLFFLGQMIVLLSFRYTCFNYLRFPILSSFQSPKCFSFLLRTGVRGDFNIHGTKKFQYAVQKSKIHDVLSLLNLWLAKKTCAPREILTQLSITEKNWRTCFSNKKLCQYFTWRTGFFSPPKVQEA